MNSTENNTIDLNRIRNPKILEEMKGDLQKFLDFDKSAMINAYEKDGRCEDDYDFEKEQVVSMLEKVERRLKSLNKYLERQKQSASVKNDSN